MSDTFWLAFFGLLTLVVKDHLDRRRTAKVAEKVDLGNRLTEDGVRKVDEVASVTKEAKETAKAAATMAVAADKKAVAADEKASAAVTTNVADNKEILKTMNEIRGSVGEQNIAINGRMTEAMENLKKASHAEGKLEGLGLHDGIVNRIAKLEGNHEMLVQGQAKLEGGHELLAQGQVEMTKAIDKMRIAFVGVTEEIKKSSKH